MAKKELLSGNIAIAEAAVRGGCNFFAGYPITPQSEILEHLSTRMPELGLEFVQAESEIGAVNMIMGACAMGGRVMTATAGMAISLMMETLSFLVGGRYPSVVINMQRSCGGSCGLALSQTDYNYVTKTIGHGGNHAYVLAPASVQEAVDMVYNAFEFAEKYRCMVFILTDSMVGQTMEPVMLPEFKTDADFPKRDWIAGQMDGVRRRVYGLGDPDFYSPRYFKLMCDMYDTWEKDEVRYEEFFMDDAEVVVVAWGTAARLTRTAIQNLRKEGLKVGMFRPITIYPFPKKQIGEFAARGIKQVLVPEVSAPAQFFYDVDYALRGTVPVHSMARCYSAMFTSEDIEEEIRKLL